MLAPLLMPVLMALLFMGSGSSQARAADANMTLFQVAFSSAMLSGVNQNDVIAAMKVWTGLIAKQRQVAVDPEPQVLSGVDKISQKLAARELDAVILTTPEYWRLASAHQFSDYFLAVQGGKTEVEYLLLTRLDKPVRSLADLKGATLICHEGPRASLSLPWLNLALAEQHLEPAGRFFSQVLTRNKASAVVLPVFFQQKDACLVDRYAYETICELNPQIGKQLRVTAVSPSFIPMLFCMRAGYSPGTKEKILEALADLHSSPSGQQVLAVLQFERVVATNTTCLARSLALLSAADAMERNSLERPKP
jgi:ABC-type phosphate/phosphonate transport system substrate-binding protein